VSVRAREISATDQYSSRPAAAVGRNQGAANPIRNA
jgi:hypothetical protein